MIQRAGSGSCVKGFEGKPERLKRDAGGRRGLNPAANRTLNHRKRRALYAKPGTEVNFAIA